MQLKRSAGLPSLEKTPMRISLGRRSTGGQQRSSTFISWKLTTPMDDWESLAPRKKSDSSLSAGAGESLDDDRESSWSEETPERDASVSRGTARAGRMVADI